MELILKKIKILVSSHPASLRAASKMAGARMLSRALVLVGGNELVCCDFNDKAA